MGKKKRVALYVRVSTGEQIVVNQVRELEETGARLGWEIVDNSCDGAPLGLCGAGHIPDRFTKGQ